MNSISEHGTARTFIDSTMAEWATEAETDCLPCGDDFLLENPPPDETLGSSCSRTATAAEVSDESEPHRTGQVVLEVVPEPDSAGTLGLVELILKNRPRLERRIRNPALQGELIPRLLGVSLASFVLFGVALALVLQSANLWPVLHPSTEWIERGTSPLTFEVTQSALHPWLDGSALALISAYVIGVVAATCVCLPSLYFYGLLAGVKMSFLDVTLHALKAKATAAIALIGILPMYAAFALGIVIFDLEQFTEICLMLGLALPFIAGLWGTRSLYVGFSGLGDTMHAECRERRTCFLRRLVCSWSAVYTAVMPVMIFTLWEYFGHFSH